MTLEQAIEFCLHMKEEQYKSARNTIIGDYPEYEAAPYFRLASEYKHIAEWLMELKEAKRLLKAAMKDMKMLYESGKDEGCVGIEFKWRFADEALKLIGDESNGV